MEIMKLMTHNQCYHGNKDINYTLMIYAKKPNCINKSYFHFQIFDPSIGNVRKTTLSFWNYERV